MTIADILDRYVKHRISQDELLGPIGIREDRHSVRMTYHENSKTLTTELNAMSAEIVLENDEIRRYDITSFSTKIYDFAESILAQMAQTVFQSLSQIIELTGNTIDARGKPPTIDLLIELYEKIPVEFDDDGNSKMPTLFVPPAAAAKLNALKPTPEQTQRMAAILEQKNSMISI